MMDETIGKELVLTPPPSGDVVKRSKPSLIQVGSRSLSSDGKFHYDLSIDYLRDARARMVPIGELAKVFYGANIPRNKQRIRRRLPELFKRFLSHGDLLVVETDPVTGRSLAVKLYDPRSEQDRQNIRPRLERMEARRNITAELFERAIKLLAQYEQAT